MRSKFSLIGVIALALVLVFAGSAFAGNAPAIVSPDLGGGEVAGDTVIFSYYDIRTTAQGGPGLSDNYFTVVNGEDGEYIQAHLRIRTGQCSVELLDFDVLLSPHDVFTFDLYQGDNGATVFASCDTNTLIHSGFSVDASGCFILDTTTFPNQLALILECGQCPDGSSITAAEALEATRWGYIEIIAEAELEPTDVEAWPGDSFDPDATECTSAQLAAGQYNAWTYWERWNAGGNDCSNYGDFDQPDSALFGKAYLARLDASGNLVRLAQYNGKSAPEAVYHRDVNATILHRPCYSDTNAGCSAGDGEIEADGDYAYSEPSTSTDPLGANDMNYCFWNDTITTSGDVCNRVGAGATFGPTFAEFFNSNGAIRQPQNAACDIAAAGAATITEDVMDGLNRDFGKWNAFSHYFYVPGQGQSRFVFTFPLQHFINQSISVTKAHRFDTEENECTLPSQKFISPGLPAPGVARGEVTIIEADEGEACAFNEGWESFDLLVTSDGPDRTRNEPPASFGLSVNWGDNSAAEVISISPLQWGDICWWFDDCPPRG